jgi:flagellar operon protein
MSNVQGLGINTLISPTGVNTTPAGNRVDPGKTAGPSFQETLQKLQIPQAGAPGAAALEGLKFSNHAVERMRTRGIHFAPEQLDKISSAIDKARLKGAKETLVLTDQSALIVSVKNNTVVTVMDSQNLKENVFTNIDSTVVI